MSGVLRVLIVGCGNIAGAFDMALGRYDFPSTHAGAFFEDDRFKIVACIEPSQKRRQRFMNYWSLQNGFESWESSLDFPEIDVVSICSPTPCHYEDVQKAILLKPKVIFCEKPLTDHSELGRALVQSCNDAGILLAVNYTRRWDPDVIDLRHSIQNQEYGDLRSVVGFYNKGILNNGSHLIDLLFFLLGSLRLEYVGSKCVDYSESDPSFPVFMTSPKGVPIQLVCGNASDFALFELHLVFSDRSVAMLQGGRQWVVRKAVPSQTYSGYRVLGEPVQREGRYVTALRSALDNIYAAVFHADSLMSDGSNALEAQTMCEKIAQG